MLFFKLTIAQGPTYLVLNLLVENPEDLLLPRVGSQFRMDCLEFFLNQMVFGKRTVEKPSGGESVGEAGLPL